MFVQCRASFLVSSLSVLIPFRLFTQESTLHLVLRLRGGAKKRKKKSYTTPKKNKHKRKKVKLAVLKYYKVSHSNDLSVAVGLSASGWHLHGFVILNLRWMRTVRSTVCGASVQQMSVVPACSWPAISIVITAGSAALLTASTNQRTSEVHP